MTSVICFLMGLVLLSIFPLATFGLFTSFPAWIGLVGVLLLLGGWWERKIEEQETEEDIVGWWEEEE